MFPEGEVRRYTLIFGTVVMLLVAPIGAANSLTGSIEAPQSEDTVSAPASTDSQVSERIRSNTRRTLTNATLQQSLPHFEFQFNNNLQSKESFAEAQENFESYYLRISQRSGELPDTVVFVVEDDVQPTGAEARSPNTIAFDKLLTDNWNKHNQGRAFRHELVHLAQFRMDAETSGEWLFLAEGHASFDSSPILWNVEVLEKKPTLSDLKNFGATSEEYTESATFVAAFMQEYGRQKFLELIRNSKNEDLETEFERVTGDSLREFYNRWAPTKRAEGPNAVRTPQVNADYIRAKAMFVYKNGTLKALNSDSVNTVRWDVDNDSVYEYSGAKVNWTPSATGTYPIRVKYVNGNASIEQVQILNIQELDNSTDSSLSENATQDSTNSSLSEYAGQDAVLQTTELRTIIHSWVSGQVKTATLRDAIQAWATRQKVG